MQLWQQLNPKSFDEIFESKNKGLAGIKAEITKEAGEAHASAYVQVIVNIAIIDLCESLNIGDLGKMNPTQIKNASQMIAQEYYFLKPDDFKLAFNMAKMGKFGKVYNRMDIQVICEFLNQYCFLRSEAAYRKTNDEHNQFRKIENTGPVPQEVTKEEFYKRFTNDAKEFTDNQKEEDYQKYRREYMVEKFKEENNEQR